MRHLGAVVPFLLVFILNPVASFAHSKGGFPPDLGFKLSTKNVLPDPGSFVNFETAHVHPLDISPDGSSLAAVNTADARVEIFSIDGSGQLTHTKSIAVGTDPVTARFRSNAELWVVNFISDSISVVDLTVGQTVATIETNDEPADVVFYADSGNGDNLTAVSCSRVDKIQVFDADSHALVDTFHVLGEDPRALDTDGTNVYGAVFNSGNSTTIIGHSVIGPALSDPAGPYSGQNPPFNNGIPGTAWVTPAGAKTPTDLSNEGKPQPPEVALIVRKDFNDLAGDGKPKWKDDNGADWTEYIRGAKAAQSGRDPGWDMIDNDILSIGTSSGTTSLNGGFGDAGYVINQMTTCMAVGVNPVDGSVVTVGTEATNEVRFEPNITGTFIRVRVSIVDGATGAQIALVDMNEEHLEAAQSGPGTAYEDGSVPQADRSKSIGDPRGVAFSPDGSTIYVTGMGSNNVVILDASTGERLGGAGHTVDVGAGPTGIVHHPSLNRLYVLNKFDASISVLDAGAIGAKSVVQTAEFFDPTPDFVNEGRVHFYNTHLNSGLGQISCASCHIDGQMDRLSWDLGDPFGEMKETILVDLENPGPGEHNLSFEAENKFDDFHFMKGPMSTQTLQDIIGKEPHHWRGDRDGIEEFAGAFAGLQGRDEALDATSMQEFENFLATIHFPPNPFRALDNSLPGGPKFDGSGNNPKLPLPDHFTSGRFAPEGSPLPDGDAWRGFQLYVDGDPNPAGSDQPPLDGPFNCVTCHSLPMGAGSIDIFIDGTFKDIAAGPNGEAHQSLVSVDGTGEKAFKTAPLRNQLDKVGFFMSPDPNNGGQPHLSRAGFGLLHDGSVNGLEMFLASNVFQMQSDQDVADVVAFTLCVNGSDFENLMGLPGGPTGFPAGVAGSRPPGPDGGEALTAHAAVGKQTTVDSPAPPAAITDLIDDLIEMADNDKIDLIVKGMLDGNDRGWTYDVGGAKATGVFQSDDSSESHTLSELLALAGSGSELTFMAVPEGSGVRMGIDRDEDTFFDFTEVLNGTDPADSTSFGVGMPVTSLWPVLFIFAVLLAGIAFVRRVHKQA